MKKRTKQHTQKQLTLRRWLLVLALFSISYFLLPITFSPHPDHPCARQRKRHCPALYGPGEKGRSPALPPVQN